ncbi:MAG: DNA polymerase III subunit delta [Rikenellaceae bacterium]
MQFKDIIGNDSIKQMLISSVKEGRIAHAQLFLGDSGYGSLALALAYAQYISCRNRSENDSCGVCSSCYKYSNLQHPDLHFIFPTNKSPLSIGYNSAGDVVSDNFMHIWRDLFTERGGYISPQEWYNAIELSKNSQAIIAKSEAANLIESFSYKSIEGGYNIVIIWMAELMNESCANALLKLFEEPQKGQIFLFVAHNEAKMLKTILSRVQTINIRPIEQTTLANHLSSSCDISIADAQSYARLSEGNLITAKTLSSQQEELSPYFDQFVALMRLCFKEDYLALLPWAEKMNEMSKPQIKEFLTYSLKLLRDAYSINIGVNEIGFIFEKESKFLHNFAPYVHDQNIEKLIEEFQKCNTHLTQNVNTKITLSHFTLAISKLIKLPK